jgi:hypothetical protein
MLSRLLAYLKIPLIVFGFAGRRSEQQASLDRIRSTTRVADLVGGLA